MANVLQYPAQADTKTDALQYPEASRRTLDHPLRNRNRPILPSEPEQHFIQGIEASAEEWRVYQALLRIGFHPSDIIFQYGALGGRNFKGGVVVDFIVKTTPLPTPIWVNGEYWHAGEQAAQDQLRQIRFMNQLGSSFNNPVNIWGNEVASDEHAFYNLIDKLGRP